MDGSVGVPLIAHQLMLVNRYFLSKFDRIGKFYEEKKIEFSYQINAKIDHCSLLRPQSWDRNIRLANKNFVAPLTPSSPFIGSPYSFSKSIVWDHKFAKLFFPFLLAQMCTKK